MKTTNKIRMKIIEKFFHKNKKTMMSLCLIVMFLVSAIGLTIAYKIGVSDEIENNFETPTIVTPIEEEFDGVVKESVTASNSSDSDVDVYVRLKFVVNTMEVIYGDNGYPILIDELGNEYSTTINEDGEVVVSDENYDSTTASTLTYKTGALVATTSSFDENGYLANHATTITNVFDVEGLNDTDWISDGDGVYYYKYSLAPGETANTLVEKIYQEVFYDGVVVTLTIIVDSVQVDGLEDSWQDVSLTTDSDDNPVVYLDKE
ncbi:hypothetical protein [Tannockella kyphosi]|uniref:hypothetical protein n=1 Tax=Tannockella kyphosi TaxID=2899121 RepID=UPI002011ECE7|nr:hypothetical protein [Tannockella kyphosi]